MESSQLSVGIVMVILGIAIMFFAKFYFLSVICGIFLIILGIAVFLSKEDEIEKVKNVSFKKRSVSKKRLKRSK